MIVFEGPVEEKRRIRRKNLKVVDDIECKL